MLSLSKRSLVILILLSSIACTNKLVRIAQIGKEVGKAAVQLQEDEIADFRSGRIDKKSHLEAQAKFEALGYGIKILNSSIKAASLKGVRAALGEIQIIVNSFSSHITSSGRLQVWITIINGFLATMVALI